VSLRFRRDTQRRAKRWVPLPSYLTISDVAEEVRTTTLAHLRTDVKSRFARIRETLPREDQELLVLRVDKQLAWDDLARVFCDEAPSGEALKRESARLRKRFQSIKDRLRELMLRDGALKAKPMVERVAD
jgi:RNA polymerase sigma-70 factor (ECF subfamily)